MEQAPPSFKRKQYLVDYAYQLRFATRVFMIVFAVAVASALLSTTLLWNSLYHPTLGLQTDLVVPLTAVAITLIFELILAVPVVYILSIRQSHRIVGPMKRLKAMVANIGQGDFSQRIKLREGDALEDLSICINQMAETLQKRFPRAPGS